MGIALRHVSSLARTFEISARAQAGRARVDPRGPRAEVGLGHSLTRFVWAKLIPGMTLVSTGSREAKLLMDYYWDTVEKCVPPETIVAAMRGAGFADVKFEVVVPGAFCEYTGTRRPSAGSRAPAMSSLNREQLEAASHGEGPALVLAGPGTGKTTTLVGRYCRLVQNGVDPRSILTVTFGRKAAETLAERISNQLRVDTKSSPGQHVPRLL